MHALCNAILIPFDMLMSNIPVLTIAIPTYNRARFLRETLEHLVPQLDDRTECLVLDNASSDSTTELIATFGDRVKHIRHSENIGSDRNMISCIERASGRYVWILCDDDLPVSNAVQKILEGIEADAPAFLFATQDWQDAFCSAYRGEATDAQWLSLDANGFLEHASCYFTAASGIVIRKDAADLEFIRSRIGSYLVPAAITLRTIAVHGRALVATSPIVICRGGNSGGYDGFTVFTRNFLDLLESCSAAFSREAMRKVYEENLRTVGMHIVRTMPLTAAGLANLFRLSWRTGALWKVLVPALLRRWRKSWGPAALWKLWKARCYIKARRSQDRNAHEALRHTIASLGNGGNVQHPWHVIGGRYISIGHDFWAGPGVRIEAWDRYGSTKYSPRIVIGNNVSLNNGVHIGAIDRVELGNNVIVGAHALFTDHSHGDMGPSMLETPARDCPLFSRGPVIVESDAWIGEGACILSGVRIGRGAVIGANAVVVRDVAPGEIVVGVPARRIRHLSESRQGN